MPAMPVHPVAPEESGEKETKPGVLVLSRGGFGAPENAGLRVREYGDLDALPPGYTDLLEAAGRDNLRWSRPWLAATIRYGASLDKPPLLLGVENVAGVPLALNVGFSTEHYAEASHCRALALQTGTEPYRPLVAAGLSPLEVLRVVARYARGSDPPYDVLRISPLDSHGELFKQLPPVLRAQGWIFQRFFMYPNWYEDVSGHDSAEYLRTRPSRLRNTIERRTRNLEKSGRSRIEIVGSTAALDTAIWDYERVFGRSWKQGLVEVPYQRAIMQVAAQAGALRLALLYIDDAPAAAQCWMVSGGVAYLHRLAYDERFGELSPGTVLSWQVIRHVLDADHVRELDFGVGDDAYKADWVSGRRERWGILAFNPRTLGGLKAAAVNLGGHAAKSVTRVILHPLLKRLRGS